MVTRLRVVAGYVLLSGMKLLCLCWWSMFIETVHGMDETLYRRRCVVIYPLGNIRCLADVVGFVCFYLWRNLEFMTTCDKANKTFAYQLVCITHTHGPEAFWDCTWRQSVSFILPNSKRHDEMPRSDWLPKPISPPRPLPGITHWSFT